MLRRGVTSHLGETRCVSSRVARLRPVAPTWECQISAIRGVGSSFLPLCSPASFSKADGMSSVACTPRRISNSASQDAISESCSLHDIDWRNGSFLPFPADRSRAIMPKRNRCRRFLGCLSRRWTCSGHVMDGWRDLGGQ